MADTKMTKRDYYEAIKATLAENFDNVDEYIEFLDNEIAIIDKRAEKEKARRAEKRAEGDELKDAIKAVIENAGEPITAQAIADELAENYEEVTKAKVVYRASQLAKDGEVYKVQVKDEKRKIIAYTAEAPEEDAE